uniref:Alpha-methylacyl-CoA racemase n=1 Tax=Ditylenchus dipsaci TaxID=166011 RepID=A0A915EVW5_9BILA
MAPTIKPFSGVKVMEFAGLAPVPFCGMVLADFGATVTVILNTSSTSSVAERRLDRGKTRLELDFQSKDDMARVKKMCCEADVLLDPFRPGTLEAIGLDPVELIKANQKLIVARLTGYGQTGPLAHKAGHDINYVALSGLFPLISVKNDLILPAVVCWLLLVLLCHFTTGLQMETKVYLGLQHGRRARLFGHFYYSLRRCRVLVEKSLYCFFW